MYEPQSVPSGPVGDLVRYGHELIVNTRAHAKPYIGVDMDCSACHVNAGTTPRGGSLAVYGQFPQWNKRANRVIALQDRLAECFLYSMNGRPPAYNSREMEALVAYIAYLSRGMPVGATPNPSVRIARFDPPHKGDPHRGGQIYMQKCAACHGTNGADRRHVYPPLWGPKSFNDVAGMHRLWTMAGFVRYNMPQNAPGTLSEQDAYDVSTYVLSHGRPHARKNRMIAFPPRRAGYF